MEIKSATGEPARLVTRQARVVIRLYGMETGSKWTQDEKKIAEFARDVKTLRANGIDARLETENL